MEDSKKNSYKELKFVSETEIQEGMKEYFSDTRRLSLSIPGLMEQIKILENEKKDLLIENQKLKQKLIKYEGNQVEEISSPVAKKQQKLGKKSVYEQLGKDLIKQAIDLQYELMIKHDDIGTQFHTMAYYCPDSMIKLKDHQLSFSVALFGGPNKYEGRNIRQAHKFKGLSNHDFDIWMQCVGEAYLQLGVEQGVVDEIIKLYDSLRSQIIIIAP